jgi:hypothetical protein
MNGPFTKSLTTVNKLRIARLLIRILLVGMVLAFLWVVSEVFEDLNRPDYIEQIGQIDSSGEEFSVHLTLAFDPEYQDTRNIVNVTDLRSGQVSEGHFPILIHWLSARNRRDEPICLKRIYLLKSIHTRRLGLDRERFSFAPREFEPIIEVDNFCFQGTASVNSYDEDLIIKWESVNLIPKTYANQFRRFPLDGAFADLFVWAEFHAQGSDEIIPIAPSISFINSQENWDQTITLAHPILQLRDRELDATLVSIYSQRPPSIFVLTALLLSLITIFIILLAFVSDTGSALEVSIAILVGLWGIQGILIPEYVVETTLVHISIYLLYLLFALVALFRFVISPLESKVTLSLNKQNEISHEVVAKPVSVAPVRESEPTPLSVQQAEQHHLSQGNWGVFQIVITGLLTSIAILLGVLNIRKRK